VRFLRDILTGQDGETYDIVRVLTCLSAVVGLSLQVYVVVVKGQAFDLTSFGTGAGLLIAAGAGGLWARRDIDPPAEAPPKKP
jgi:nitrate reductase gamma subunit